MALTDSVIIARYQGILRKTPTADQVASLKGLYATEAALDNALLTTAVANVNPVVLLYQSAFGRVPDADGLNFWVAKFNGGAGATLDSIGNEFFNSKEWGIIFDQNSPALIIQQLYQNILGRNADTAGLTWWVEQYNNGVFTLAQIAVRFAVSDELTDKFEEAISDLLVDSANNAGKLDATETLWDWIPDAPPPAGELHNLTKGADTIALGVNDTVKGFSDSTQNSGNQDTYNGNDSITGTVGGNNKFELSVNGNVTQQGTVRNVDLVAVQAGSQATTLNVSNWTGIKTVELNQIKADFTLDDIQQGATQININDKTQSAHTIKLNYDSNEFGGVANIGVKETFATVVAQTTDIQNGAVKTINLSINDTAGHDSTLADLVGHKTETLNITGGYAGGKFKITGALDKTLTKIDASTVLSNLDLNVSETGRKALEVTLGKGNDLLRTGDTLNSNDVLKGGEGSDVLSAVFTSGATRSPTVSGFEKFDLTFNANTVLNFENVDDVATILIQPSSNPFRLHELDSTVKTLDVEGRQANSTHHIYYADDARNSNLQVNWNNDSGSNDGDWESDGYIGHWGLPSGAKDGGAGTLDVENAGEFHFTHSGEFSTFFTARTDTTEDAWQFDIYLKDAVTRVLTVENTGQGDLVLANNKYSQAVSYASIPSCGCECGYSYYGLADIGGTNKVTELSFKTTDTGNIELRDVRNVAALRNFTVDASNAGDIFINSIGAAQGLFGGVDNPASFNAALRLETIDISASQKAIANVNYINGLYNESSQWVSNGATISTINLTAQNASEANLWGLSAGDVENVAINVSNGASVGVCKWELVNDEDQGNSLGSVIAKGAGELNEGSWHGSLGNLSAGNYWDFTNQSIAKLDFSGLTKDAVHVDFSNDNDGVVFTGTNGKDLGDKGWVGQLSRNYTGSASVDVGNDATDTNVYGIGNVSHVSSVNRDNNVQAYTIDLGKADGDWVIGGNGNDVIRLGGGNDFAYGGAGHNQIYAVSGTNYIVTGAVGTNEIWAGTGQDFIFLNNASADVAGKSGPNVVNDFTAGQDKLIIDISDVEAKAGANLVWTYDADLAAFPDEYRAAEYITVNSATNVSGTGANIIALDRQGTFQDYTDVLTAIQGGGDLQISTNFGASAFEVGDALTLAWHDQEGDLHLSLAKVTTLQTIPGNGAQTYNFQLFDVAELVGQTSWINWQSDLLFTA